MGQPSENSYLFLYLKNKISGKTSKRIKLFKISPIKYKEPIIFLFKNNIRTDKPGEDFSMGEGEGVII